MAQSSTNQKRIFRKNHRVLLSLSAVGTATKLRACLPHVRRGGGGGGTHTCLKKKKETTRL